MLQARREPAEPQASRDLQRFDSIGSLCGGDGSSCAECESDPSTWIINPPDFEFNGSLTAAVLVNGEQIGSDDDMLAGFVDDELRGVITGLVFPPTGEIVFNLMLFSNAVSGETVNFKYFHVGSS